MVVIGFSNRVVRTVGSGGFGGRGTGEGQKHLVERWAAQADVVDGDASIGEHPYGLGQAIGSVDNRSGNAAAGIGDPRQLHSASIRMSSASRPVPSTTGTAMRRPGSSTRDTSTPSADITPTPRPSSSGR